jgi:transposase-like protein
MRERGGNLESMDNRNDELRARIARGWTESGLSQPQYAQQHGITERTLRAWRAKYCADRLPPGEAVREAIVDAMERLRAALDVIDRVAAGAEAHDEQVGSLSGRQRLDDPELHKADAASVVPNVGGDVAPTAAVRDDRSSRSRREQSGLTVAPRGRGYFSDM